MSQRFGRAGTSAAAQDPANRRGEASHGSGDLSPGSGRRARDARRGAAVVGARRRQRGAADGGAGRDRGEHRAAVGAARAGVLRRGPPVGGDRLCAGVRQPAADRREAVGPAWPQPHLHGRPGRVRRRVGAGRGGAELRGPGRRPGRPGRVRGAARAGRAGDRHRDLRRQPGPRPRVRDLRRGRRDRRRDRPAARRPADRVPELALDAVCQPGVCRHRADRGGGVPAARGPASAPAQDRPARHRAGLRRAVPARLRAVPGPGRRLARARLLAVPDRRSCAARRVHRLAGPGGRAAAAAAGARRPRPRRLDHRADPGQRRDLLGVPVPDLLPAGRPGLHPGPHRAGVPAMIATTIAGAVLGANVLLTRIGPRLTLLLILGLGLGLIFAPAISLATARLRGQDTGVGSALVNTTQQVGGAVGIALLSTLAASATTSYLRPHAAITPALLQHAAVHGYTTAYWAATAIFAAGALLTALLYRSGRPDPADLTSTVPA